jgi:hypothetical protein
MTDITSAQTGNWSSSSTWLGGSVPGDGDRAIIDSGHVVTVTQNTTVGTDSDANDIVIQGPSSGGGGLIVNPGITLTLKGSINSGGSGSYVTMEAGSTISQSVSTTHVQRTEFGNGYEIVGTFNVNGTSTNKCTFENLSSYDFDLYSTNYKSSKFYGSYLNLKNIHYTDFVEAEIDHWIWDENCGDCNSEYWGDAGKHLDIQNCVWKNSSATVRIYFNNPSSGAIKRIFKNNVLFSKLDDSTYFGGTNSIDGCIILGDFTGGAGAKGTLKNCYMKNLDNEAPSSTFFELVQYCFFCSIGTDNQHFLSIHPDQNPIIEYCVCESFNDWILDVGDQYPVAGSSGNVIIRHCVELPNPNGRSSGALWALGGGIGVYVTGYNNTFIGYVLVAETYEGHENMVTAFYNNILWYPGGNSSNKYFYFVDGTEDDLVVNADYCCSYGTTDPWDLTSNAYRYVNSPGSNDLNEDPNFYDSTRDFAKWAVDILGSTEITENDQRADAEAALAAINEPDDPNYNVDATIPNFLDYIFEGFTPQNMNLATAGIGGSYPSYIGAIEPSGSASNIATIEGIVLENIATIEGTNIEDIYEINGIII